MHLTAEQLSEPLKSYLPTLEFLARKAARNTLADPEDLVQEGIVLCLKLLPKFDASLGKFETFMASNFISYRLRGIAIRSNTALSASWKAFLTDAYRDSAVVREGLKFAKSIDDVAFGDDGDETLADVLEQTTYGAPDECCSREDEHAAVRREVSKLKPKHRAVIERRFGFDCDEQTLGEVGDSAGISKEAVRLREERALKTLRVRLAAAL